MLSRLETPHRRIRPRGYSLEEPGLPFALTFAKRRVFAEHLAVAGSTSSDGTTSGSDGAGSSKEEFDFIEDD